jgi:hypothetical protein
MTQTTHHLDLTVLHKIQERFQQSPDTGAIFVNRPAVNRKKWLMGACRRLVHWLYCHQLRAWPTVMHFHRAITNMYI